MKCMHGLIRALLHHPVSVHGIVGIQCSLMQLMPPWNAWLALLQLVVVMLYTIQLFLKNHSRNGAQLFRQK